MLSCIITSEKETTSYDNVESIIIPAHLGQVQILPDHADAFFLLNTGEIIVEKNKKKKSVAQAQKGVTYVKNNNVTILL